MSYKTDVPISETLEKFQTSTYQEGKTSSLNEKMLIQNGVDNILDRRCEELSAVDEVDHNAKRDGGPKAIERTARGMKCHL